MIAAVIPLQRCPGVGGVGNGMAGAGTLVGKAGAGGVRFINKFMWRGPRNDPGLDLERPGVEPAHKGKATSFGLAGRAGKTACKA